LSWAHRVMGVAEDSWGWLGRNRQLAFLLWEPWHPEIQRALAQVKRPVGRTGLDPWFRRQGYLARLRGFEGWNLRGGVKKGLFG
jgi:hypothetical protein